MKSAGLLNRLISGRWQAPMVLLALASVGFALHRLQPKKTEIPFETLLADILALAERGHFRDAADAAGNLLAHEPPLPVGQRAVLHSTVADILYRQESVRETPLPENVEKLLEHHELAVRLGREADAVAALRAAQAYEWQRRLTPAINEYRLVLERSPGDDLRRRALTGLVRLMQGDPAYEEERRGYIGNLLSETGVSSGFVWDALRQALQDAIDHDELDQAAELLANQGSEFKRSDLQGYHDFLWAWLETAQGRTAQAFASLDKVDEWLRATPTRPSELDRTAYLPALSDWLRGELELMELRPQAALEHFERALNLQPFGEVLVYSSAGKAKALGLLERHDAARDAIETAMVAIEHDLGTKTAGLPSLRAASLALFDARHDARDHGNAIRYLEIVRRLTPDSRPDDLLQTFELLAAENDLAARQAHGSGANALRAASGRYFEEASRNAIRQPDRFAELLWRAAAQYDAAGQQADTRRALEAFIAARERDPRLAEAMLRLGRSFASEGRLPEAQAWYRELTGVFPKLTEATQARLLLAESLLLEGDARRGEAEQVLLDLVGGGNLAPAAREYRDALFQLCQLYFRCGLFAEAIARCESFLELYPNDPDDAWMRFMLADAYRRSAIALRDLAAEPGATAASTDADQAPDALAAAEAARESRRRFQRAASLYSDFLDHLTRAPAEHRADPLYEKLSLFHRGDCLYQLNEPATLDEALATFRQAAARYRGDPASLTAQVQIANIFIRQGRIKEAAAALERARWLLGAISDQAFAAAGDGCDRAHWTRLLAAAGNAHLFRSVRETGP